MRIVTALVALLVIVPSYTDASPVVFMDFLNSDFTFGTVSPDQRGYDSMSLRVDGLPPSSHAPGNFFRATGSRLVQQTVYYDTQGVVTGSEYLYTGGTLHVDLTVRDDLTGVTIASGDFIASIVALTVSAAEEFGSVLAFYKLGPGLFDPAVARALNIGANTLTGRVASSMHLTQGDGNRPGIGGTYMTPVRQAWDGYTVAEVTVPEPHVVLLAAGGIAAALWRQRRAIAVQRE